MISKKIENKLKKIKLLISNVHKEVQPHNRKYLTEAWDKVDYVQHMQVNHRLIENQALKKKY